MGRTLTTALVVIIVGLLLGMGIGGFITYNSTKHYLQVVPGAPIVVGASYDREQNRLNLDIFNPGGLPIVVDSTSLIFKPQKGNGYVLANIPSQVVIPPTTITRLVLNLRQDTKGKVQIGDILVGGFTYHYPAIKQIYTTSYTLTVGTPLKTTPEQVLQKAKESAKNLEKNNKEVKQ